MLAVTSYEENYVSGSQDLFNSVSVRWLLHNFSLNGTAIRTLDGNIAAGGGMERLSHEIDSSFGRARLSSDPLLFGLRERRCYYNRYPEVTDRNKLGIALYLNCHGIGVMFVGSVGERGLSELLKTRVFRRICRSTHVYITPSSETIGAAANAVAAHLKHVYYVVISDRGTATSRRTPSPRVAGLPGRTVSPACAAPRPDNPDGWEYRLHVPPRGLVGLLTLGPRRAASVRRPATISGVLMPTVFFREARNP